MVSPEASKLTDRKRAFFAWQRKFAPSREQKI